jgi:hypothetical protein
MSDFTINEEARQLLLQRLSFVHPNYYSGADQALEITHVQDGFIIEDNVGFLCFTADKAVVILLIKAQARSNGTARTLLEGETSRQQSQTPVELKNLQTQIVQTVVDPEVQARAARLRDSMQERRAAGPAGSPGTGTDQEASLRNVNAPLGLPIIGLDDAPVDGRSSGFNTRKP